MLHLFINKKQKMQQKLRNKKAISSHSFIVLGRKLESWKKRIFNNNFHSQ